jgi:glycosyltransferase involved in cell wall biosynthesis
MKILFYCTFPNQSNGYARIGNNITNYLVSNFDSIDIFYFGITASDVVVDRFIHPKIKLINVSKESPSNNPYGDDLIQNKINEIQPDIVFLYNDILVLSRMIQQINQISVPRKFKVFTYMDLVYEYENKQMISFIDQTTDKLFVFSECWKRHLENDYGLNPSKIFILNHGIDNTRIFPVEKEKARSFFGFQPNDFVILNLNRNTHRKAIDITIRAYLGLLKKHLDKLFKIKLFLNGQEEQTSYPNLKIIELECKRLGLDYSTVTNHLILVNKNIMSDFELNLLYNACDVGINTCVGEGFGLCCLEHASVGKPQIMTKVGALNDIFDPEYSQLIYPSVEIFIPNILEQTGGYFKIGKIEDFINGLEIYLLNAEKRKRDGEFYKNLIPEKYDWNKILKSFCNEHLAIH